MVQRFGPKIRRRRQKPDPAWKAFFKDDPVASREQAVQEVLELPLADTHLSVRVINTLEVNGILTVADLASKTRDDLLEIENFGDSTLLEVRQVLDALKVSHPRWFLRPKRRVSKRSTRATAPCRPAPPSTKKVGVKKMVGASNSRSNSMAEKKAKSPKKAPAKKAKSTKGAKKAK